MLKLRLDDRLTRGRVAEEDASMDGISVVDVAGFGSPQPPKILRPNGLRRSVLLTAIIVVVTLAVLILLDHAGIRLPATDDLLVASPLD